MIARLTISAITWVLIGGFCLAVLVTLDVESVSSLTFVILAITVLVAAVIYLVGRLAGRRTALLRQRSAAVYETTVARVWKLVFVAVFIVVEADLVYEWFVHRNQGLLWAAGLAVVFVLVLKDTVSMFDEMKERKGELLSAHTSKNRKLEMVVLLVGSCFLAGAVVYAISPLIVPSFAGPQDIPSVWIPLALWAIVIWALLVASSVGMQALHRCLVAARQALPDSPPAVEVSADPVFGKRSGNLGGTSLLNRRVMGIRVPVNGKGFEKRGNGSVWLAEEAIAFLPALSRTPLVIPYALIHALSRKEIDGKPWLSVVWGRPELPMETSIQISGKPHEIDLWAQEISRRTAAWKAKAKAVR